MFKLMKVSPYDYLFYSVESKKSKSGSIEHIADHMTSAYGFQDDEIDKALMDMGVRGTNVSEFNANGRFVGSTLMGKEVSSESIN